MLSKKISVLLLCLSLVAASPCKVAADSLTDEAHAVMYSVETVEVSPYARSGATVIYTSTVSGSYGLSSGVTVSGTVSGRYSSGTGTVTALFKETTSFKFNSGTSSTHATKSSGSAVSSFSWSEYDANQVKSTTTVTVCKKNGYADQTLVNFTSYAESWGS